MISLKRSALLALFLTLLCPLVTAAPAEASDRIVLAVLYFDNNTGAKEFDVLQKGFADMLITDLAADDDLVVVEREKLQALVEELELQKSDYFDKKTAIKLGKGLGAGYAVTGSFAQAAPKIRIDVRMVAIDTGKVVASSRVVGKPDDIFELEQQLVEQFLKALKRRFDPPTRPPTKVPDLPTLVDYSKAIDHADRGDLKKAEATLKRVVSSAPLFGLARVRKDQFTARLKAARETREDLLARAGEGLVKRARQYIKSHELQDLDENAGKVYLAYRLIEQETLKRKLLEHAGGTSTRVVRRGHEKKARRLLRALYDDKKQFIAELEAYRKKHNQQASARLPQEEREAARQGKFPSSYSATPERAQIELAEYLLLGEIRVGTKHVLFAPPLAEFEPKYRRIGFKLLESMWKLGDKQAKSGGGDRLAVQALELHGEALLMRGDVEGAVTRWQKVLDLYPTSTSFGSIERRIKEELGLKHNHSTATRQRYHKALKTCDDMDLRVGWGGIMYPRTRMLGIQAIPYTVAEIEKHCKNAPKLKSWWPYLYKSSALSAGRFEDCEWFDAYLVRFLAAGGSRSDAAGYKRNYAPACQKRGNKQK